jgi:MerR family transcriptional regulator, copper efflux regulator
MPHAAATRCSCNGRAAVPPAIHEGIRLGPPAGRTDGGYRLSDDRTLARLAFITRAKQLGCTLEKITELVEVWNGDRCGPVQRLAGTVGTAAELRRERADSRR